MTTVNKSFTALDEVSGNLKLDLVGVNVTVNVSGTYDQDIWLERAQGPDGLSWERVVEVTGAANATIITNYTTRSRGEVLRLHCTRDGSGTGVTTLSDSATEQHVITDKLGRRLAVFTDQGVTLTGTLTVDGATTLTGAVAGGAQTVPSITGSDSSLGVAGQSAAQGGEVAVVGGQSTTAANAGGAVSLTGGIGTTTAVGGAGSVKGGAGVGAANGGAATVQGGDSGAGATGAGGDVNITGGAAASTNGDGGSVVLTPGAKTGTGIDGGIFSRGQRFFKQSAALDIVDTAPTLTAAQFINGIVFGQPTTGRAVTTPTGAQISAGCGSDLAVGDSFEFTLIVDGSVGADDIYTLTAGDGNVTLKGVATLGPIVTNTAPGCATWIFRNTGASTWVGYRRS